jgi:hypothetical protein
MAAQPVSGAGGVAWPVASLCKQIEINSVHGPVVRLGSKRNWYMTQMGLANHKCSGLVALT